MTNKRARDDSSFPHEPGGTRPWAIRSKVQQSVGQQPAVENSNNTDPLLTNDQIILILDHAFMAPSCVRRYHLICEVVCLNA